MPSGRFVDVPEWSKKHFPHVEEIYVGGCVEGGDISATHAHSHLKSHPDDVAIVCINEDYWHPDYPTGTYIHEAMHHATNSQHTPKWRSAFRKALRDWEFPVYRGMKIDVATPIGMDAMIAPAAIGGEHRWVCRGGHLSDAWTCRCEASEQVKLQREADARDEAANRQRVIQEKVESIQNEPVDCTECMAHVTSGTSMKAGDVVMCADCLRSEGMGHLVKWEGSKGARPMRRGRNNRTVLYPGVVNVQFR